MINKGYALYYYYNYIIFFAEGNINIFLMLMDNKVKYINKTYSQKSPLLLFCHAAKVAQFPVYGN